jgi:hypothetical protein
MGKFSDAIKEGRTTPHVPEPLDSADPAADKNAVNRVLRSAWIDTVLNPVIADVNEDIKIYNLRFLANVKEDAYSIFIELRFCGQNSDPINLIITVRNDLDVMIYILSGKGINIGTVTEPNRLQLEDQLVDFLRHQSSLWSYVKPMPQLQIVVSGD